MSLCLYLSISLSVYLSISPSLYLSIYLILSYLFLSYLILSIYNISNLSNLSNLSITLSICLSIYLSMFLFYSILFYLFYLSIYVPISICHSQDENILKHTSMLLFLSFEFERITSKAKPYAVHVWNDLPTCGAIGLGTCWRMLTNTYHSWSISV